MYNINETDGVIQKKMSKYPLFEHYRIVDTNTYMIYKLEEGKLVSQNCLCFEAWKRENACINCISKLAASCGSSVMKMETVGGRMYLIQALPIPEMGGSMVLELIREVTGSFFIGGTESEGNMALTELVQKLNDLSVRDPYTGLYNKRYLEYGLRQQIEDWTECNPVVIVLFDIDRFKFVNDTYGHLIGDQVIMALAQAMERCTQQNNGWAGRVGGDEFIMTFHGISRQKVELLVKDLRDEVAEIEFGDAAEERCRISISAGIAEYRPDMENWEELFKAADRAMYEEKQ